MNSENFIKIISTFADNPLNVQYTKGEFIAEIRGEVISAQLRVINDNLFVFENSEKTEAKLWIKNRIAELPLLAERIIDYIPYCENFVDSSGRFLGNDNIKDEGDDVDSCINTLTQKLQTDIPDVTNVMYLTSDAGDGKTTIINQLAVNQAKKFKKRESNWLLVPIPLGGRPFLRFDDIVVASLVNTLRFRYLYYESFIELIKLGLIVPAFDGFEEMFMQSSTGEALTATGELINRLDSRGSILIAARKAYFDYKSFSIQAKLYDSIRESVIFSKLEISRWGKEQFIQYASKRAYKNAANIYNTVVTGLRNSNHSILTRPILVKQLLDVIDEKNINTISSQLGRVVDYFPLFIHEIINREASQKWIDTSGSPQKPLISIENHYNLLALLAEEMWQNNTNILQEQVIDFLAEMYCEQVGFNNHILRQVKERLKQHALIVKPKTNVPAYKFDHDEFFNFFLGIDIANNIKQKKYNNIKNILRKGIVTDSAIQSAVSMLKGLEHHEIINVLEHCMYGENRYSYIKENIGNITIRLLQNRQCSKIITLHEYVFPIDSFVCTNLHNIIFNDCYIQGSSLDHSVLAECTFNNCQIDRLEINSNTQFSNVSIDNCVISMVYDLELDKGYYDSCTIETFLTKKHITFIDKTVTCQKIQTIQNDEDLELTEKALRRFIRSNTPINDTIFLVRLGNKGEYFIKNILKDLVKVHILRELPYTGQGQKRRYKLNVQFKDIERALTQSRGSYRNFLEFFSSK